MIVLVVLVALLAFVAAAFFSLRKSRRPRTHETGGLVIAFGDSLIEGDGASPGQDLPSLLSAHIGIPIVNAGIGGDTTATALARLDRDVLGKKPRLVIILLGGNDALRRVPEEETRANLRAIIAGIQGVGAKVLLLGIRGGILHDKYETMFDALAREMKSVYVSDMFRGIFGHPKLMTDPIHPNDAGYAMIADRIEPILREMLE